MLKRELGRIAVRVDDLMSESVPQEKLRIVVGIESTCRLVDYVGSRMMWSLATIPTVIAPRTVEVSPSFDAAFREGPPRALVFVFILFAHDDRYVSIQHTAAERGSQAPDGVIDGIATPLLATLDAELATFHDTIQAVIREVTQK